MMYSHDFLTSGDPAWLYMSTNICEIEVSENNKYSDSNSLESTNCGKTYQEIL